MLVGCIGGGSQGGFTLEQSTWSSISYSVLQVEGLSPVNVQRYWLVSISSIGSVILTRGWCMNQHVTTGTHIIYPVYFLPRIEPLGGEMSNQKVAW